jgi:hypothetical protein
MDEQEVVNLMLTSKSEDEWNRNCDTVKSACGGYPPFWYPEVLASGLFWRVQASWK